MQFILQEKLDLFSFFVFFSCRKIYANRFSVCKEKGSKIFLCPSVMQFLKKFCWHFVQRTWFSMQFETNYAPITLYALVACSKNENFRKDDSIANPSLLHYLTLQKGKNILIWCDHGCGGTMDEDKEKEVKEELYIVKKLLKKVD